jgi:predicted transcriptional regulator
LIHPIVRLKSMIDSIAFHKYSVFIRYLILMKYRSRTDIVGLILEAANGGGATKTRIMYKAFLSYAQLKEYLTVLLENGLIDYEEGRQFYRTTEKGIRFLQMYNQFDEMMSIESVKRK